MGLPPLLQLQQRLVWAHAQQLLCWPQVLLLRLALPPAAVRVQVAHPQTLLRRG